MATFVRVTVVVGVVVVVFLLGFSAGYFLRPPPAGAGQANSSQAMFCQDALTRRQQAQAALARSSGDTFADSRAHRTARQQLDQASQDIQQSCR